MVENFIFPKEEDLSEKPEDKVISKIKEMINLGTLKPGDKLPAERKLASGLGIGRTHVRKALHKLEFYGIIKTLPQSGSIIKGLDINTLDGLISDVLNLQSYDFYSLVETRCILEMNAVKFCAKRRTEEDIKAIENAHENFVRFFEDKNRRVAYDFAFHRSIAEASHNPVINAMLLIIIPDIMLIYNRDRICDNATNVIEEHAQMLEAIKKQKGDLASCLMLDHLQGVINFAKSNLEKPNVSEYIID
jgi:GntR family transcriptional repressor for pyruvate dehydrogenase complex